MVRQAKTWTGECRPSLTQPLHIAYKYNTSDVILFYSFGFYSEHFHYRMCMLPWLLMNRDNYDIFATTANYSTTITIDVNNGGHSILPFTIHDGEVSVNQHVLHDCTDHCCSRLIHTPVYWNIALIRTRVTHMYPACACISRINMCIWCEHVYPAWTCVSRVNMCIHCKHVYTAWTCVPRVNMCISHEHVYPA
jgi:hypothetical protein